MTESAFVSRAAVRPWRRARAGGPFTVASCLQGPRPLVRLAAALADRVLGLHVLQALYADAGPLQGEDFAARALEVLDVGLDVAHDGGPLPTAGGLLVVANHPSGALDGLAMLAALARERPDVKVLGNAWLAAIPELRDRVLGVDPFGQRSSRGANAGSLRAAIAWLAQGGTLLAFPAGEVAHRVAAAGIAIDGEWHPHVSALGSRAGVPVVPAFVAGTTRRRFRLAGVVHPLCRTMLLPRELLARRGTRVSITFGETIDAGTLGRLPAADRSAYLQTRTFLLASSARRRTGEAPVVRHEHPLSRSVAPERLASEVAALDPVAHLVTCGSLEVYCVRADEAPLVLEEIGHLRERTFRAVGEGTGRPRDLDAFDRHYRHLFAWDPRRRWIAGAYRLSLTSEVLPTHGLDGLYTRTLFDYDERLLAGIGPALELGRSFVREECQRGFAPLLALWRGIGAFLAAHPDCRAVFGAVSISSRYDTLSRRLLVRFLESMALHPAAARLVRPRRPLPPHPEHDRLFESATVRTLDGVTGLVAAIERDGKAVPVLLRQYLNLNARLLGFSVDPAFGDALDGLMVVDLAAVPRPMLERVMGADAAARVLGHNAAVPSGRATRRWSLPRPMGLQVPTTFGRQVEEPR